jgi:hypothetical protein
MSAWTKPDGLVFALRPATAAPSEIAARRQRGDGGRVHPADTFGNSRSQLAGDDPERRWRQQKAQMIAQK